MGINSSVEGILNRQKIYQVCGSVPIILSWTACVWVLGLVAGGAHASHADEGVGFHVFWLLIFAQVPFVAGCMLTADWSRWSGPAGIVLQIAALVVAFSPVAYFRL